VSHYFNRVFDTDSRIDVDVNQTNLFPGIVLTGFEIAPHVENICRCIASNCMSQSIVIYGWVGLGWMYEMVDWV
jgi:hypothetical protein